MSDTSRPIPSPHRLRDQAIAALIPFFSENPASDLETIRSAAEVMLDDYNAVTPKELQLSAQIIALGWAAMACLRAAVTAKNLSVREMLDLQDNAIALDRSSQKAIRALKARQKERATNPRAMTLENTIWDEGAFQLIINQALEKMNDANVKLAAYMATLAPVKPEKLPILFAEPMTSSVLAARTRG